MNREKGFCSSTFIYHLSTAVRLALEFYRIELSNIIDSLTFRYFVLSIYSSKINTIVKNSNISNLHIRGVDVNKRTVTTHFYCWLQGIFGHHFSNCAKNDWPHLSLSLDLPQLWPCFNLLFSF